MEYQEELKETLDNYIKRYEGGSDEQKRSVTTENGIIKPVEEIAPLSYIRANDLDVMQIEKPFFVVEKFYLLVYVCLPRRQSMENHGIALICVYL